VHGPDVATPTPLRRRCRAELRRTPGGASWVGTGSAAWRATFAVDVFNAGVRAPRSTTALLTCMGTTAATSRCRRLVALFALPGTCRRHQQPGRREHINAAAAARPGLLGDHPLRLPAGQIRCALGDWNSTSPRPYGPWRWSTRGLPRLRGRLKEWRWLTASASTATSCSTTSRVAAWLGAAGLPGLDRALKRATTAVFLRGGLPRPPRFSRGAHGALTEPPVSASRA
jgi:hypothetical protein